MSSPSNMEALQAALSVSPWADLAGAGWTWRYGQLKTTRSSLRHQGNTENSSCSPWIDGGRQWWLATVASQPSIWAMAWVASGGVQALGTPSTEVSALGGHRGWVFIGVELYVRRKNSSIQILLALISLTKNLSSIRKGGNLQFGYDPHAGLGVESGCAMAHHESTAWGAGLLR
jgi:hypothetical protein